MERTFSLRMRTSSVRTPRLIVISWVLSLQACACCRSSLLIASVCETDVRSNAVSRSSYVDTTIPPLSRAKTCLDKLEMMSGSYFTQSSFTCVFTQARAPLSTGLKYCVTRGTHAMKLGSHFIRIAIVAQVDENIQG